MPQKSIHNRQTQGTLSIQEDVPLWLFGVFGGFIFFYGVIVYGGLRALYSFGSFSLFMVVLANIDMIGEILAYSIPSVFGQVYDPDQKTVLSFISFNLVCIIAISGVLLNGLIQFTHRKLKIHEAYFAMAISYLVTFLLPTPLIPDAQNYSETFVNNVMGLTKTTIDGVDLPKLIGGILTMIAFITVEDQIIEHVVLHPGFQSYIPGFTGLVTSIRKMLR
jgi:glucan phosphoethanolaminetransferase (alkaline phosphatase superfamily)